MTVSYNEDIINTHSLTFLKVIFRWRGSIWKSVLYEVTLWLLCFYTVMFVYRVQLRKKEHQIEFEHIAKYTDGKMDYLPLSFMLGFYVAFVVDRWKQIFANIGFVDSAAFWISTYIVGDDFQSRTYRRNFIRYLCLTQVLVLRDISIRVRRRFPSTDSLVEAGLLQEHEQKMVESIQNGFPRYWVPIHWMFTLGHQLVRQGKLTGDQYETIMNEAKLFREKLQMLINYDWVPVPLAYSQVVFMATRMYFFLCLFTRQFRIWEQRDSVVYIEYYFPLMTFLQLICYMGWLKVAESLLNPLGEDDEDFESSYIIDRNLAVGMTMVDECYAQLPRQMPDTFGKEGEVPPPYTEPTSADPQHQLVGSAKLAAASNPAVILPDRANPSAHKNSVFARLMQKRSSVRGLRRKSMIPMEEEGITNNRKRERKSKSIAGPSCAASSADRLNWLKKMGGTDRQGSKSADEITATDGIKFYQTFDGRDGQILGKFSTAQPKSPGAVSFSLPSDLKNFEKLSEEEDDNGTIHCYPPNNDNGSSSSSSTTTTTDDEKKNENGNKKK